MPTNRPTCHCPDRRCQWYAERERWEPVGWVYHAIGQNMPTVCPPHCPWCGDALTPGVAVPRPPANTPDGARVLARYMRALELACREISSEHRAPLYDLIEEFLATAALAEPPEGEGT